MGTRIGQEGPSQPEQPNIYKIVNEELRRRIAECILDKPNKDEPQKDEPRV